MEQEDGSGASPPFSLISLGRRPALTTVQSLQGLRPFWPSPEALQSPAPCRLFTQATAQGRWHGRQTRHQATSLKAPACEVSLAGPGQSHQEPGGTFPLTLLLRHYGI